MTYRSGHCGRVFLPFHIARAAAGLSSPCGGQGARADFKFVEVIHGEVE